jgi:poly(A) polymerase
MSFTSTQLTQLLVAPDAANELRAAWSDITAAVPALGDLAMPLPPGAPAGLHKDTVEHTIVVVAQTPSRLRVRLLALFHDVGKPATRVIDGRDVTFINHEVVGGRMTYPALRVLGYEEELSREVASLVALSGATKGSLGWSDSAVRRLRARAGHLLDDLLDFADADVTSRHQWRRNAVHNEIETLRRRLVELAVTDQSAKWRPVVSGDDIMQRYGLRPGREVGQLLKALIDASRDDVPWTSSQAWELLDQRATPISER